jgi:hypothetical protein
MARMSSNPGCAVNPVLPYAGLVAIMDLLAWALAQPGINPQVSLYTNPVTPSNASVLSDFTPATAPGLTAQALGAPTNNGVNALGRDVVTYPVVQFTASGGSLPVTVYGWVLSFIDPATSTRTLFLAQRLPNAFAFFQAGDNLPIPVVLSLAEC